MLNLKRLAAGLTVGLGILAGATAHAATATRIVVVTHGQAADPYWSTVKKGVDDAAKTMGVDAEYISPETFDMVRMAQMIDGAVASKPDGLVVSIPDADALGPSIKQAAAAGIPIIVIDSGGPKVTHDLGGLLYLGQTEYDAGLAAGERMKPTGITKAACLNQEVGNTSLDDRCAGFAKGLGIAVPVVAGTIDPTEMKARVSAYLRTHPDTQFLLACGAATAAEPALAAVKEAGLIGKVKIGTFDLSPGVL